MNILCIDIGGTNIKYTLFSNETHGEIKSVATPKPIDTANMKVSVFKIVDEYIENNIVLDAVSISNCAQMKDNIVVFTSSKPGYIGCNWANIIEEKYNIPCVANNDVHCAALGEYIFGLKDSVDKPDNFLCLAIGTGINVGVVINKEIFSGDAGLACYLDNLTDLDGNNQFKSASTASLLKLYLEQSGQSIDGKDFIKLLKNNDFIAKETYDIWITRVAHIIKNVLYMYNINNLSICGGIINADYPIVEDIKNKLQLVSAKPYWDKLNIYKSTLSSSQLFGTYAFALKRLNLL